ncbi:MAG: efflux RND transporter permease subunit [Gammaproteobacteria bacterium]|nr:MAG: efflux RND transporter permease subunit [Gammaproteobacteria bacterium]
MILFSIRNPLLANLFLVLVLITGIMSWYAMPQEMFPNITLDKVRITTIFEGASPEEVERQVTLPIEQELDGLEDIDTIQSTSAESRSQIIISLNQGANVDDFIRETEAILDRLTDLPEAAEKPQLSRMESRIPVISVALYGDVSTATLSHQAEEIQDHLLAIPGVASAAISGNREWELWVTVDPALLSASRTTTTEIITALRNELDDLPGGQIEAEEGEILLRGQGVSPEPEEVAQIPVRKGKDGGLLRLGRIARIEKHLEEAKTLGRFNGKPSLNLTITKTASSSTLKIADAVYNTVESIKDTLPANIHLTAHSDMSIYLKNRLNTVKSSAIIGLGLVLLSLYLFLNFRVAFVTALGIPVSFLVGIILMQYMDQTVNMISLFAFLIALGMVVDDAIIVTENIYRHMEMGQPAQEAAMIGAREVMWPVVASTATTIAAFLPMFSITGTMGAFIKVIPLVVIACLLGSLLEAFAILPSHSAHLLKIRDNQDEKRRHWRQLLSWYTRFIRRILNYRGTVATLTVCLFIITIAFAVTRIPFMLFGKVEIGQFFLNIEAPRSYALKDSERLALQLEKEILAELDDHELKSLITNLGVTFIDFNSIKFDTNYIQMIVTLKQAKPEGFIEKWVTPLVSLKFEQHGERVRPTSEIINRIRARLENYPGIERLSILRPQGGPAGADIEVGITGKDTHILQQYSQSVAKYLESLPGVHDVAQDLTAGKQEIRYALNDYGRQLGLNQAMLASAIRTGYQGLEVTHVTLDNRRVPVRLIYPESIRQDSEQLEQLPIVLPNGKTVYLRDVADIYRSTGFDSIRHRDLETLATVTAEVDTSKITAMEATQLIEARFAGKLPSGYDLIFLGEKKEAAESFSGMFQAMVVALTIIFIILVALFRSLLDPFLIMLAIPFGVIGVVFGHLVTGHMLQFLSMIGLLALSGIVVNDSLILIDFAKTLRAEGMDRIEAIVEACRIRARPIILTSLTTFLGVSPLIFFASGQTAFLSPMAVSLGFGLLFATVLILVVLPCFYIIADDIKIRFAPKSELEANIEFSHE